MVVLYTYYDVPDIIESIEDYISQCDAVEQEAYYVELNAVRYDFYKLVESGVFHDAIGKTLNVREIWGNPTAEVETEY